MAIAAKFLASQTESSVERLEEIGFLIIIFQERKFEKVMKIPSESVLTKQNLSFKTFQEFLDFKFDLNLTKTMKYQKTNLRLS